MTAELINTSHKPTEINDMLTIQVNILNFPSTTIREFNYY